MLLASQGHHLGFRDLSHIAMSLRFSCFPSLPPLFQQLQEALALSLQIESCHRSISCYVNTTMWLFTVLEWRVCAPELPRFLPCASCIGQLEHGSMGQGEHETLSLMNAWWSLTPSSVYPWLFTEEGEPGKGLRTQEYPFCILKSSCFRTCVPFS